jgi:hypothetical protein
MTPADIDRLAREAGFAINSASSLDAIDGRIARFAALVEKEKCEPRGGRRESRDVWAQYKAHLLRLLNDKTKSGAKKLRVAIDASNGINMTPTGPRSAPCTKPAING